MAGILDLLLGESEAAPFTPAPSLGEMLSTLYTQAPAMAGVNNAYNAALMPGQMKTQLGAEALFDPRIAKLRGDTTQAIADQLALGGSIPPDVLRNLLQAGFERNSMTGLGGSGAGRGVVAGDLGTTTLDLIAKRIAQAGDWTRTSPLPGQLFQPTNDITPGFGASYESARNNANNAYQQYLAQVRNQNSANMIDRPLGIISTLAGAYGSLQGGGASPASDMQYPSTYEYGLNNPSQFTPYAPVATPSSYGIQLRGQPGIR